MAVTPNSLITPQSIHSGGITFTSGDTTVAKTIFTPGTNGTIVSGLSAVSNDTALINLQLYLHDGTTLFQLGTVRIAIASGTDGATVSVNLLSTTQMPFLKNDAAGNPTLLVPSGWTLRAACLATMTGAKMLWIVTHGEDL